MAEIEQQDQVANKPRTAIRVVVILLAVLAVVFCVASVVIDYNVLTSSLKREDPGRSAIAHYDYYAQNYEREPVEFTSGETHLQGYYYGLDLLGDDDPDTPRGVVVFCHGITSWHQDYLALITALVDDGWVVFAYDATGSGESEGDSYGSLSQSALDADAALSVVEADKRLEGLSVVVVGHSWGGFAAGAVLGFDHDVSACVCLSGYSDPMAIITEWAGPTLGPLATFERPFLWVAYKMIAGDYADLSAVAGINSVDIPVLVIHGTGDATIKVDEAAIYAHRGEITNPHVQYLLFSDENRDGHNTYFVSAAAREYAMQKTRELEELQASYDADGDGKVDDAQLAAYDEAEEAFYANVDLTRANEPNPEFIGAVTSFLDEAVAV